MRKIYGSSSSEEGLFLNASLGYVAGSPSIVLFLCVLTDDIFALSTTALSCPRSQTDSSILRRSEAFFLEFFQNSLILFSVIGENILIRVIINGFILFIPRDVIDFSTNYSKQMQQKCSILGHNILNF